MNTNKKHTNKNIRIKKLTKINDDNNKTTTTRQQQQQQQQDNNKNKVHFLFVRRVCVSAFYKS